MSQLIDTEKHAAAVRSCYEAMCDLNKPYDTMNAATLIGVAYNNVPFAMECVDLIHHLKSIELVLMRQKLVRFFADLTSLQRLAVMKTLNKSDQCVEELLVLWRDVQSEAERTVVMNACLQCISMLKAVPALVKERFCSVLECMTDPCVEHEALKAESVACGNVRNKRPSCVGGGCDAGSDSSTPQTCS